MKSRWALIALLALAACQPSASDSPSPSEGAPSAAPSASEAASEAPAAAGTITIVAGGVVDGPGLSIPEALDTAGGEPVLVNGTLLLDTEGTIWLCEELSDSSPRACAGEYLRVESYPEGADAPEFDPENADVTGSQEEDGVVWLEDQQLYGTVEPS
jgi:hypothetical protein